MKPNWNQNAYGIDRDYLRRCKEMTPGQRIDWLAAAREFANISKRKVRLEAMEDLEDIKVI